MKITVPQNPYIKYSAIAGLVIVLYALLGFLVLPYVAKRIAIQELSDNYQAVLQIDELNINPFTFSAEIKGLSLAPAAGEVLVSLDRGYANLQLSSLLGDGWVLQQLEIEGPDIKVELLADGTTNLAWLTDRPTAGASTPVFNIRQVAIHGGRLVLANARLTPALAHSFSNLELQATDVGTHANSKGQYRLSLENGVEGQVRMEGEMNLAARSSRGTITLTGLGMAEFVAWVPPLQAMKIDGTLALALNYALAQEQADLDLTIDKARLKVSQLQLQPVDALTLALAQLSVDFDAAINTAKGLAGVSVREIKSGLTGLIISDASAGQELLRIDKLQAGGGRLDGAESSVSLETLDLAGALLTATRDEQGRIDWLTYINVAPEAESETEDPGATPVETRTAGWQLRIANAKVQDVDLRVDDRALAMPVMHTITGLSLDVTNISNLEDQQASFSLQASVNEDGRIEAEGWVVPSDASTEARIKLDSTALPHFNAYLQEISNLRIDSGAVQGEASIRRDKAGFSGEASASVKQLTVSNSLNDERVIAAADISATQISVSGLPFKANIKRVKLDKSYANIAIDAERRLNVSDWFKNDDKPADSKAQTPADTRKGDLVIERIEISDAAIDFSDHSLTPHLTARLDALEGSVANLDIADKKGAAALELNGRVGEFGQVNISGNLTPLDPVQHAEINMLLQNMDTSILSPYAGRFAGRRIKSGKLDLDLDYRISGGQIKGDNAIVLKDFVLGEKVESSDALDLPLDMAIALLEDKNGRIDIKVPVSGDLNNPKFDIRAVIGKAVGNMVKSIVFAPFKALSGLFGGKDVKLDAIPFKPGRAAISPPAAETLAALSKALDERPALSLKVMSGFDPQRDRKELATMMLRRQVMTAMGAEPDPVATPGPLTFADANTQQAIAGLATAALPAEHIAQIRAANPEVVSPAAEGEEAGAADDSAYYRALFESLRDQVTIGDDVLVALAASRAQAILAEITGKGIAAGRIVIAKPAAVKKSADKWVALKLELFAGKGQK